MPCLQDFRPKVRLRSRTLWRNYETALEPRQRHAALLLILAAAIGIGHLADLIAPEEQELADAFAGIDARGQRRGVRYLDGDVALPFGLQWRDVDDDAAARIGRLAETDHQRVARNAEILYRRGEREAVGRHDADVGLLVDYAFGGKMLRIVDGARDIGEDLEVAADARVVAVGRQAIGDDALARLLLDEGLDHGARERHLANPFVRHDQHECAPRSRPFGSSRCKGWGEKPQAERGGFCDDGGSSASGMRARAWALRRAKLARSASASRACFAAALGFCSFTACAARESRRPGVCRSLTVMA